MTRPVEENDVSDITETALVINGGVLAPIRANSVDNARKGITIAEGAEVATVADNEFSNIQEPGDDRQSAESDGTDGTAQADTADETTSVGNTQSPSDDGIGSESGASGPGFGIASALAGLGGAGYLLKQRLSDDSTNRSS